MPYIDERFKEAKPEDTVAKIKGILDNLGITVTETWFDSGLENCFSLSVAAEGGVPSANGKGITKEFAQASAYGEFIERLQGGLHFYKYQSIHRDPVMHLQGYAPDGRYMTLDELEQHGEWMDFLIDAYPQLNLTRKTLAEYCRLFACADDGKVLTLPFYSLFENKHVYLPIDFVDQVFASNGCCVGNTRDEAWVHALSEMLERHANLKIFSSGGAAPRIPDEVIDRYPVASRILKQIRENGEFDIDIFDYSLHFGFPIVSTRIINKKTHGYKINVAADPIFEIALQRTLTETFQGKNIHNFVSKHGGAILKSVADFPLAKNVINQLETGNGLYTADFFANELTCTESAVEFPDHTDKNNRQLLECLLDIFRKEHKPVYVRNFSYLGFPCYRFVVPGFSEIFALKLGESLHEIALADEVSAIFKNPLKAGPEEWYLLLAYSKMIQPVFGRYRYFNRLSGVPISWDLNPFLADITRSFASYQLGSYADALRYLNSAKSACDDPDTADYLTCVGKYIELKNGGIADDKIRSIVYKFFLTSTADRLYGYLDDGKTPYEELVLTCDLTHCGACTYRDHCRYAYAKTITETVGNVYRGFVHGQDASEFAL